MEKGGDRMDILFTIAIEILKVIAREVAVFFAKRVGKYLSTSWKQIQKKATKNEKNHPPCGSSYIRRSVTSTSSLLVYAKTIFIILLHIL